MEDWKSPFWQKLHWTYNSSIHVLFLAATACAVWQWGKLGLLLYPLALLIVDILYYFYEIEIFDPSVTIASGYQMSLLFNDTPHSQGLDYGFNYYNGDYKKTRAKAQQDKFDHIFKELELQPGMKLLDVGCGCGDWLDYLRKRGVQGVGVNITHDQAVICRKRGLTVYWTDWKKIPITETLSEKIYGKFDRLTFLDTVEHYVPATLRRNEAAIDAIYRDMFTLAKNALKPTGTGKVFISCLHVKGSISDYGLTWKTLRLGYCCYLLDKFHSGNYPNAKKDSLVQNAKGLFELEKREDLTLDYCMTSHLEPTHFGRHKHRLTLKRALYSLWLVVVDPFWFQRILWFADEGWMQQFSANVGESHMILWWLTFREVE